MRSILLFAAACCLASCGSFRRTADVHPIDTVDMAPSVAASLDTSLYTSGDWPDASWWKMYGDEQLDYLVDVALKESPTLSAAYSRVQAASAAAKGVASSLYPKATAHFQELYAHLSDESLFRIPPSTLEAVINQVDLGVFVNYEFDFWGKNTSRYRAALGHACAKKAEEAQAVLTVTSALVRTYVRYQFLLERRDAILKVLDATKEMYDLRLLRKANGLDDQFSLDAVEEHVLTLEETVVAVDAAVAVTQMQLKVLLGRSPDDQMSIERPTLHNVTSFPLPNKLSLDLLARRPDLMAAKWNAESKAQLIGAAKAAFFPSVNLAVYGGAEALSWGKLFNAQSLTGFLFPSVNLPLFTGFKLEADLDAAHEAYAVAAYDYNGKVLEAAGQVTEGLRHMRAAFDKRGYRLQHVHKKRDQYQLEDLRYETGVAKKLDVLQRKIALLEDTLSLLDVEESYFDAMVTLIKALGGGYGSE